MSILTIIALVLVIIGALNWGLVGLFRFDLVSAIFGGAGTSLIAASTASRIVFVLVAIAGLWCIPLLFRRDNDEDMHHDMQ
ncbi:MAG: DUF378 domain-containing protein [Clostridia bacterium]|nr:DUF378 domain-containing protein [Clostridia bacterium]